MKLPCFEKACCPQMQAREKKLYKIRIVVGGFPIREFDKALKQSDQKRSKRRTIKGRETYCKECWDKLPEEEKNEFKDFGDAEVDMRNYKHHERLKQSTGLGNQIRQL